MIKFEIPSVFNIRLPNYSFGDSEAIPALRLFPPFLKSELYALVSEDPESKRLAGIFNRFVVITLVATFSSFVGMMLCVLARIYMFYFYYRSFMYSTLMMLLVWAISSFMSWYNLKRMANVFSKFFNETREGEGVFVHYEVNDNGIFKMETSDGKTDLA